jgi:2-succinyl-6-hydroxy-2,4-cyclohexadiene-1-carboxylate synthase
MWVSRSAALIGDAVGVPETVVLLHGFAGTGRLWDPVAARLDGERYRPLAPDIRGHGTAAARSPASFDGCVEDVLGLIAHPFTLVGYSMGGRIALRVALAAPQRIERLILVATTAGIEDPAEREQRRIADEALATEMEQGPIEAFADRWTTQPLFAGTPPEAAASWRADILDNDPAGLAAALRGLGTGVMEPLWDRLGELTMPATVLTGERDAKFRALGGRLAEALPRGELVMVEGAGHGIPREQPAAAAAAIALRSDGST